MTAKYSTAQDDDVTHWHCDRRYVLARWSDKPFVGHRHRHETVEHRLVIEYTHEVGADILHECRSEDTETFPDEWAVVERVEIRDYGARHDRDERMRWLE
jgi:hypothetical protein